MAYTQANNPFKKLLSDIGSGLSKLNIKSPSMSSSTRGVSGQRAYQQAQLKRPSHLRESKFEYDVRMREQARRAKRTMHDPDKDRIPTGVDATPWGNIPEEQQTVSTNPGDLRSAEIPSNFGIIPGMTFGEAFAQAGKGGARAGIDPFFWTNPDLELNPEQKETKFLYDFADKETKTSPHLPKGY